MRKISDNWLTGVGITLIIISVVSIVTIEFIT